MARKLLIIKIEARSNQAPKVQEALTKHGCVIRTRLGIHEVSTDFCSEDGLVILELLDNKESIMKLKADLETMEKVTPHYLEI
ncbi:MAG TPA: hypothetical protein VLH40_10425 [Atribacteraceae bacterium]|nr:hypothetical protein [Atribacteraceae bacterium]